MKKIGALTRDVHGKILFKERYPESSIDAIKSFAFLDFEMSDIDTRYDENQETIKQIKLIRKYYFGTLLDKLSYKDKVCFDDNEVNVGVFGNLGIISIHVDNLEESHDRIICFKKDIDPEFMVTEYCKDLMNSLIGLFFKNVKIQDLKKDGHNLFIYKDKYLEIKFEDLDPLYNVNLEPMNLDNNCPYKQKKIKCNVKRLYRKESIYCIECCIFNDLLIKIELYEKTQRKNCLSIPILK